MSEEPDSITCKVCGDRTNSPPPEFPPEWEGYCPPCAIKEAAAGNLPKCSMDLLMKQIFKSIGETLGIEINVQKLSGATRVAETEDSVIFAAPINLN